MKTIFDEAKRTALIARIDILGEDSPAQWGKMNVFHMVEHCICNDTWMLGKDNPKYKQVFLGKLFGKMALNSMIGDEKPLKPNITTLDFLKIKDSRKNLSSQKKKWIELVKEFEHFSNPNFIHTFCGKMTREQIGYFNYKHTDRHLRQFGS